MGIILKTVLVWVRMFVYTGKKELFTKYPDLCGQGLIPLNKAMQTLVFAACLSRFSGWAKSDFEVSEIEVIRTRYIMMSLFFPRGL